MIRDRPVSVMVRARSDQGKTRDHNEDTFLIADLTEGKDLSRGGPHRVGERGSVFLVADGMGGAAAGELASSMAAEFIFNHLADRWRNDQAKNAERFASHLRAAVEEANDHLYSYAAEHPDVRGMGTTATVVGVLQNALFLAQVGDSRGYLIRNGIAYQLTKDQSLMQRLVDAGELTEEEAANSERRNIILQALGPDPTVRVDLTWQELRRGDTLVICSDGLTGQVRREEIAAAVRETQDLDRVCEHLIGLANERGGPDNITVVAARFDGPGLRPDSPSGEVGYQAFPDSQESEDEDDPPVVAKPEVPTPAPEPSPPSPVTGPVTTPEARRSGSPRTLAVITVGILLLLAVLYFVMQAS